MGPGHKDDYEDEEAPELPPEHDLGGESISELKKRIASLAAGHRRQARITQGIAHLLLKLIEGLAKDAALKSGGG